MKAHSDSILQRFVDRKYPMWIGLSILCLLAYSSTFGNGLMDGWDDQWQVVNAYTSGGWSWANVKAVFLSSFHGQYSPLNQLLYMAIYSCGGYQATYYHGACLALHIGNVCWVYGISRHVMSAVTLWSPQRVVGMAGGVALIFGLHPLQVESVAWVSASKILLSSWFYLWATYTYILYIERTRLRYYVGCLLLFLCAYGAKEQTVVFPIWLMLLSVLYGRALTSRRLWMPLTPFFIVAAVMGLIFLFDIKTVSPFSESTALDTVWKGYDWWQRLVFSFYVVVAYVSKFLLPIHLKYKYFFPMSAGHAVPLWLLAYPALVISAALCFWKQLSQKAVAVGGLFFLIHILLVLHLLPISRQHIVADRYMYLPLIGLAWVMCYAISACWYRWPGVRSRWILSGTCLLLVVGMMYQTWRQTSFWYSTERLNRQLVSSKMENASQPFLVEYRNDNLLRKIPPLN